MSEASPRPYLLVSGLIFGVIAILHVVRLINGWSFNLGPWSMPLWISGFGALVTAILCIWALRLASGVKS